MMVDFNCLWEGRVFCFCGKAESREFFLFFGGGGGGGEGVEFCLVDKSRSN